MSKARPMRGLTLTVTERCNMSCSYCYVPAERSQTMSRAVADASVDFLLEEGAGSSKLSLFFFGGEPLLARDLVAHASDRFLSRAPSGMEVDLGVTTNGTVADAALLDQFSRRAMRTAVSVDGLDQWEERRFGTDAPPKLDSFLALEPGCEVTARMTVTPQNVGLLADNVRALAKKGFRRIVHLPAFELHWDDESVGVWRREHERIGTWLQGAAALGRPTPDLQAWRSVEEQLLLGRGRRHCGAGTRSAAVAADGGLFPCYRYVFAAGADEALLGDVFQGFVNEEARAVFAALHPEGQQPVDGSCETCPANDGCTHFCPAIGHWMSGDPRIVPASVCRLTRAQVAAIRPFASLRSRKAKTRWPVRAAAVAAAVLSVGATACRGGDGGDEDADVPMGGVCPMQIDADAEDADVPMGGVCPMQIDADAEDADVPMGGVCPMQIDADAEDADVPMGGVCPIQIDAGDDDADVPMGGVCPMRIDADPDDGGFMPGIC